MAIKTQSANDILKTMGHHAWRIFYKFARDVIFALLGVSVFTTITGQSETAMAWLTVNIWLFMYYIFIFTLIAYGLARIMDLIDLSNEENEQ